MMADFQQSCAHLGKLSGGATGASCNLARIPSFWPLVAGSFVPHCSHLRGSLRPTFSKNMDNMPPSGERTVTVSVFPSMKTLPSTARCWTERRPRQSPRHRQLLAVLLPAKPSGSKTFFVITAATRTPSIAVIIASGISSSPFLVSLRCSLKSLRTAFNATSVANFPAWYLPEHFDHFVAQGLERVSTHGFACRLHCRKYGCSVATTVPNKHEPIEPEKWHGAMLAVIEPVAQPE